MTAWLLFAVLLQSGFPSTPEAIDPEETRTALRVVMASAGLRLTRASSCYDTAAGKAPTLGEVMSTRLAYLDRGENIIQGHCKPGGACWLKISHANEDDVAAIELRFQTYRGRVASSTLRCAITP